MESDAGRGGDARRESVRAVGGFGPAYAETGPLAYAEAALDASALAWTAISADGGEVPTPLPTGPMAPAAAAGAAALDAAIHAWDIAVATGQGSPLTPELAGALTPVAKGIVEPLRQYGASPGRSSPNPAPMTPRCCSATSAGAPPGRRSGTPQGQTSSARKLKVRLQHWYCCSRA